MKWHQIPFSAVCLMLFVFNALATVRYVDLNCATPTSPCTSWDTAATSIQPAINLSLAGDTVLVTNGIYQTGGAGYLDPSNHFNSTINSRIMIPNGIIVASANGPSVTVIKGGLPFYTCALLFGNATLSGFTLTNGKSQNFGGGVYCQTTNALIFNCIICSNSTTTGGGGVYLGTLTSCILSNNYAAFDGGGAYGSVLSNCTLVGNTAAAGNGGGAFGGVGAGNVVYVSILNNCSLVRNTAVHGGGASGSLINNSLITSNYVSNSGGGAYSTIMNNCVITYNSSAFSHSGAANSALTNCTFCFNLGYLAMEGCTFRNCILYGYASNVFGDLQNCCAPFITLAFGNIAAEPLFVNTNNDFHLQTSSPCINAGNNNFVSGTNDLDGNPRIKGGTVDIGAYEYQTPSSLLSYAWAQQYGLATDGLADTVDADGDGLNNWQEWKSGTIPTNATSVLQLMSPSNSVSGVKVTWQSVSGVTYYLQRGADLAVQPTFTSIQSNLVGQAVTTSYTDTTATNGGPYFYRVGVQ